jgi:flagella basal body P-ring formation protein FlgA
MMPLAALAIASCLAVRSGSDEILAADFAVAIPGLTVPIPETPVALAPAPGVKRIFRALELHRLAARFGWTGTIDDDVCVERPVSPPDPAKLLVAMRKALPDADLSIVDYGRQPLPDGDLEFEASGLRTSPADALWIGYVRYAKTRRFGVWVRVKVLVPVTRVVAVTDLAPGRAIAADDLRVETKLDPPSMLPAVASPEAVIGKWPHVAIRAGTAIRAVMLEAPKEVVRGDTVTVDVFDGAAHLAMEAVAEGSGAAGDTIPVFNPDSKRRFPARIEGKGKVSVGRPAVKVNP